MHRLLDAGDRPAQINLARLVVQVVHRRMRAVICAKHLLGLFGFVRLPTVGDRHGAQDHALLVAQRNVLAQLDVIGIGHSSPVVRRMLSSTLL